MPDAPDGAVEEQARHSCQLAIGLLASQQLF
jgi:hypothetical protein